MKKKIYLSLVLFLLTTQYNIIVAQQQVSIDEIKKVAVQSLKSAPNNKSFFIDEINVKKINTFKNKKGNTLMYETILDDGQSVLLSGSKACLPVLGYFNLPDGKSIFDDDMPCGLKSLLEEYQEQIDLCFQNDTVQLYHKNEWLELLEEIDISQKKGARAKAKTTNPTNVIVAPLTTSLWEQSGCQKYNYYTPAGCDGCNKLAGCVAVAMAQIMYYWKYPVYNYQCGMVYDWCNMVDELDSYSINYTSERNAVARLIKDCADAVDMNYGCSGSGADALDARDAFVNRFSYSNEADAQRKACYSNSTWKDRIKTELNQGRPVLYRGRETDDIIGLFVIAGHAFVCDGYANGDYFHFNWGWGGSWNGWWFTLDDLTPSGDNYNSYQAAVFYIHPKENQDYCNYNLSLLNYHFTNAIHRALWGGLGVRITQDDIDAYSFQNTPKYATILTSAYPATIDDYFIVPTSWYTISSGTTQEYVAHEEIVLQPGFEAKSGSNFTARIEPCANCSNSAMLSPSSSMFFDMEEEETPLPAETTTENTFTSPMAAWLGQNVPNPAQNMSSISYFVPENAASASIQIFSVMGQEIYTIPLQTKGGSAISIEIATFPKGLYLYSLVINGKKIDTKRMIVL